MTNRFCIECGSTTQVNKEETNSWRVTLTCTNQDCLTEINYKTENRDTIYINKPRQTC